MSYLVLHIDTEFIVGTVCADNGTSYAITNDNDDFWLYFFNDPHLNRISFGKENRTHYNNREINYHGRFFDLIEDEQETFTIRGIRRKSIELLEYSGLLKTLKDKFEAVTHEATSQVPTLVTFSLSIGELAKQKTVEYLKGRGFRVDSYTIPLSELVCYYPFHKKEYIPATGSMIILLAATDHLLHLMSLTFTGDYFPVSESVATYKGRGIDPRKKALVKFVVNEINKSTGALTTQDEIEDECARKEPKAEDWLKRLDSIQLANRPMRIDDSLYIMPSTTCQVLVRKEDVEVDTGYYIQELMDLFDAYKNDNVSSRVDAVFLLGDCFQNSLVRKRFENHVNGGRLFVYADRDIRDIISVYPLIDFKRYIDQEQRSKLLAAAEQQKQAEQRAFEDRKRKQEEEQAQRNAKEKRTEANRKEAEQLFETATELEKRGQLEDARLNAENASNLDKLNKIYKQYVADLTEKIENLNAKNELYKSYLNSAEKFVKDKKWDDALGEYESARMVFDNAEIIKRINEVKRKIKDAERNSIAVTRLLTDAESLIEANEFLAARDKIGELLSVDKDNHKAQMLLSQIEQQLERQKEERHQKKLEAEYERLISQGDAFFDQEKWDEALQLYESASNLCPAQDGAQEKMQRCTAKINKLNDTFSDLKFEATVAENKNKLTEALALLERARGLKPDDTELHAHIKRLKNKIKLDFGTAQKTKTIVGKGKPLDDDFLSNKSQKKSDEEDEFIPKSVKRVNGNDFLETHRKGKPDFDKW